MIPFTFRIGAALLAAAALVPAQEPAPAEALTERARSAPAEFAADALLRLAESGRLAREKKREAIEEAFRLAAGAQQPLKKRAVPAARSGAAVFLDRAFAQDLDSTSLRSRAVRAMLPEDGPAALRMFREIAPPAPPRLTCDDALAYDVSAYYEALGEVAAKAFTPAQVEEEEPFKLLAGYVRGVSSPSQVAPVARMLASADLKRPQLETLAATFAGMLEELAGDDRSFSYSISQAGGAGPAIAALAASCKKLEIPTAPLVEAYRAYLVRHLRAVRCSDGGDAAGVSFGVAASRNESAGDPAGYFNQRLREDPVPALEAADVTPEKVEGAASGIRPCDSLDCRRLADLYRALVFGPDTLPYGPEKKATGEWQAKVKEYLAALAAWKDESGSSAAELFRQKCSLYSELSNVVPNGPDRIVVLRAFVDFLQQNSFQQESRMEWFLPVNSLVARVSLDPLGLGELWNELRGAGDPVMSLYAALEEIAPRSPGSRLSIF